MELTEVTSLVASLCVIVCSFLIVFIVRKDTQQTITSNNEMLGHLRRNTTNNTYMLVKIPSEVYVTHNFITERDLLNDVTYLRDCMEEIKPGDPYVNLTLNSMVFGVYKKEGITFYHIPGEHYRTLGKYDIKRFSLLYTIIDKIALGKVGNLYRVDKVGDNVGLTGVPDYDSLNEILRLG